MTSGGNRRKAPAVASAALVLVVAVSVAAAAVRRRAGHEAPVHDPVDLSVAGAAELSLLPGIGPALAEAIVADRAARGPFNRPEDLDRVRGVGPAIVAAVRPHVSAHPPGAGRVYPAP